MSMRKKPEFLGMDNWDPGEKRENFLFHLQRGLLLALREQGRLNPMQLRHAEDTLRKHRLDRAKRKQEES